MNILAAYIAINRHINITLPNESKTNYTRIAYLTACALGHKTINAISKHTGLSEYQIRALTKQLKIDNLITVTRSEPNPKIQNITLTPTAEKLLTTIFNIK